MATGNSELSQFFGTETVNSLIAATCHRAW